MAELHRVTIDGVEYDLPSGGGGGIDPSVIADEWDPNTEYWKNEFCFHNGILWCAVQTTYEEPSEDSDDWNNVPLASIVGGIQDNLEYLYFETINTLIIPSLTSVIGIIAGSTWKTGIEYHKGDIVIKPFEMGGAEYYELWECLIATDSEEPSDDSEYWKYANLIDTVNKKLGTDLENIDEAGIEKIKEIAGERDIISDAYDPSKTYTPGQYCLDDNTLWRCLIQNENTKPTEGTYWTRETIGNNLITTDGEGNRGYLKADGSFSPFSSGGGSMKLAWESPEPWLMGTRNADNSYVRAFVYYTRDYGFIIDPTKEYLVKYTVTNNLVDWIHTWLTIIKKDTLPLWSTIVLPDGNKEYIMTGGTSDRSYVSGYSLTTLGDHTGTPYNLYLKVEVYELE